jgi:D-xylose transport system permease protein
MNMRSSSTNALIRSLTMPAMLLAIWVVFALLAPQFLSARNISMLMIELSITATLAVGILLVLLPGHTDLSVGAGAGMLGGLAAVLVFRESWPAPASLAVSLLLGVALYAGIGWFVVVNRIQAFIVTLGFMLMFRGAHWAIIQSTTVPVARGNAPNMYAQLTTAYLPHALGFALAGTVTGFIFCNAWRALRATDDLATRETTVLRAIVLAQLVFLPVIVCNQYNGVPVPFVVLGLVAGAVHMLTQHTPFGRYLYAIGGNEEAAILSGINAKQVVIAAFTALGGIVAVTGFMQTAYAGASTTTVGELMELDAIAACVIGGARLKGGRGSVHGTLFGALIMASLLNGLGLLAVPPEVKFIARGAVLLLAVWVDARFSAR